MLFPNYSLLIIYSFADSVPWLGWADEFLSGGKFREKHWIEVEIKVKVE
jgi:hypothetical protein